MKEYTNNNPVFSEVIKILETSDPAHADLINQVITQLFQNTKVVKDEVDEQKENMSPAAYAQTITSYADLMANTVVGYLVDALAVKEGFAALGGWAVYPEELTQAQYDALPAEVKSDPKLIFVVRKG